MKLSYTPSLKTLSEQLEEDRLVEELKKQRVVKAATDKQEPSTERNLARDPAKDDEWIARLVNTVPDNWKAVPDAKTTEEAVAMRRVDPTEVQLVETTRRRPKNSFGQSNKAGSSPERKNRAMEAILFTPPAKVTKAEVDARAVNLVQLKSTPIKEEWRPMPWYEALWHWVKGNKIRSETKLE